jgi:hypothetical protein
MHKTNTLTKLRFKPQVSAAFASVSILIDANRINPEECCRTAAAPLTQGIMKVRSNGKPTTIAFD